MTETTLDIKILETWVGKTETSTELISPRSARLMQATLDQAPSFSANHPLPPFWHYLYFNPETPASNLKEDGHEKLGRFLPPVALPRRMWAGGRVEISRPILIGEVATKTSVIESVAMKDGRSGSLCFVTVRHELSVDQEPCFSETQDIVYREMPAPGAPTPPGKPAPTDPDWSIEVRPDPVMLFRYSALIFYGHRIHYDIDYTRDVEGYPGLVVHGPLTASLLIDAAMANNLGKTLTGFQIRAMSPLFSPSPFRVEGKYTDGGAETWARNQDGNLAMTVSLTFD